MESRHERQVLICRAVFLTLSPFHLRNLSTQASLQNFSCKKKKTVHRSYKEATATQQQHLPPTVYLFERERLLFPQYEHNRVYSLPLLLLRPPHSGAALRVQIKATVGAECGYETMSSGQACLYDNHKKKRWLFAVSFSISLSRPSNIQRLRSSVFSFYISLFEIIIKKIRGKENKQPDGYTHVTTKISFGLRNNTWGKKKINSTD